MHEDEIAIRSLVDEWMAATQSGNLDGILALMSDDVVFMTPGNEPFGKAEFAAAGGGAQNMSIEGTNDIVELRILGDWAWMRNHIRVAIHSPGSDPMIREGYTLTILHKQDGKWLLTRDANLLMPAKQ